MVMFVGYWVVCLLMFVGYRGVRMVMFVACWGVRMVMFVGGLQGQPKDRMDYCRAGRESNGLLS